MSDFIPTPEQEAIVDAAKSTTDNLLVNALAGAAKTSSLVLLSKSLSSIPILCLAFNKKIAVEMQDRLPGNCTSMTLNSLGHRAWAHAVGKRLVLDNDKVFKLLKEEIEKLTKHERDEAYELMSETLQMIRDGKSAGYIPSGRFPVNGLLGDDDFFTRLETEPTALQERLIHKVSAKSIVQAQGGIIDFADQILMPTLFPAQFPKFPLVMVDEAQDLSELNHLTLRKLFNGRIIAVGDPCQAIYGFRGAHEDSMAELAAEFDMTEYPLSISFRCPRAVVREAQWRAPHMRWPEWAEEGEVRRLGAWSSKDLPAHAAVICRNNAPLYSLAIRLLKVGRYCKILGNDIGKGLIKQLQKLGESDTPQEKVFDLIDKWEQSQLMRSRNESLVHDKAECMRIFAEEADTLGGAVAYAQHIMNVEGPLTLMTGHKSKGLEYNEVFFLDQHLVRDSGQDPNLRYVIQTRAKRRLTYIESEHFMEAKDNET